MEDLELAVQVTMSAMLSKLRIRVGQRAVLDIAVPLNRFATEAATHAEFLGRSKRLINDLYLILDRLRADKEIPSESLDARLLPITEPLLEYTGARIAGDQIDKHIVPFSVPDLISLALSQRPWKRLFYVDSPQGDGIFLKFRRVASRSMSRELLDYAERLPGGIQMLVKHRFTTSEAIHLDTMSIDHVIIGMSDGPLHVSDKLKLTVALLALPPANTTTDPLRASARSRSVTVVFCGGHTRFRAQTVSFLSAIMGLPHVDAANDIADGADVLIWERVVGDGTRVEVITMEAIRLDGNSAATLALMSPDTVWLTKALRKSYANRQQHAIVFKDFDCIWPTIGEPWRSQQWPPKPHGTPTYTE
ncbi:hypothetical protein DCS_06054 [Drechmeria coniospora]|uniref:Uncharacterized protein n=1 Tax=Drechmeria coniospora TaxID=98403 RepID=A0A151GAJ1_DRECN|nr:hypothetical protein DCS_06054 [Drechmeria coniospora]KYK54098.1 hypothetical protein DCS_06054 [Drechmeria coniospora]ODA77592.1 hypothetical protein RJ55_07221 [Drechmeria coniospora]